VKKRRTLIGAALPFAHLFLGGRAIFAPAPQTSFTNARFAG